MKYFSRLLFLALLLFFLSGLGAQEFTCDTPGRIFKAPSADKMASTPDSTLCSSVFVQVDYGVIELLGLQLAQDTIKGLMKEVAVGYNSKADISLSYNYDFLTSPQYTQGGSYEMLIQFQQANPVYDGDVAILLYLDSSGGIAWVDVSCKDNSPFKYAFANIEPGFRPYEEGYSWSVEVVMHELGHSFGSPHTHDPAWNGNNTSIDGCGGGNGPIPAQGGTIMSYCHTRNVGISFERGFHPQVVALMRANVFDRCTTCGLPDPDDGGDPSIVACEENAVLLSHILDAWPDETSYSVSTVDGELVFESEPFTRAQAGKVISDTLCLLDGCYTYTIVDSNGLAPHPEFSCVEGYYLIEDGFGEFGSGQDFQGSESVQICLNAEPPADDCETVPTKPLLLYANQHRGGTAIQVPGGVQLDSNTWRAIPNKYTTGPNTVLKGEVKIDRLGEIHGIAFVDDIRFLSPSNTLQFAGTQRWGRQIDRVDIGGWQTFEVPVGQILPNWDYTHFVLVNDKDPNGAVTTTWRNLELCEVLPGGTKKLLSIPKAEGKISDEFRPETPRSGIKHPHGDEAEHESFDSVQQDINSRVKRSPYPNPVTDTLNLTGSGPWILRNTIGNLVDAGFTNTVNMDFLPPGIYLLWQNGETHKIVKQ